MKKICAVMAVLAMTASSAFAGSIFNFDIGIGVNAEYDMVSMRNSANFGDSISPVLFASLENVSGSFLPIRLNFRYRPSRVTFWDKETTGIIMGTAELKLFTIDPFKFYIGGGVVTDKFKQSEKGPKEVYGCASASADIEFSESFCLNLYTVIPAKQISGAIDQKRDKYVDTEGMPHAECGAALILGLM